MDTSLQTVEGVMKAVKSRDFDVDKRAKLDGNGCITLKQKRLFTEEMKLHATHLYIFLLPQAQEL